MKRIVSACLTAVASLALVATSAPAVAQRTEQGAARKEMRAGNIMRSRDIEARILPQMRGYEYLGFAYDSTALAYRLKFIRDGHVVFVDVDARTGRVLNRSR
ncbi:MAG: PepSY domain-containing protein [Tsuneonella suprasediminis]|uniref:PepSY domain-containing protein n=1 Tax=Tsuneonella suprasediminis TaxID=2306996 RepID=A0A419R6B3_9SPHN|nr:PepSY domain-containing protein [Tsuneonella suprasediminis]RJX71801.1 hypothetical protein D6858_00125 [Tsuneonella suprasediminis]UBS32736.1 PepSY domain-containing protein [Altererythrobacter sp. N1]